MQGTQKFSKNQGTNSRRWKGYTKEVPYSELPVLGATIQNLVARAKWCPGFVHPSPCGDLETVTIGASKVSNHAVEAGIGEGTHVFEVTLQPVFMN
jgi:hypothetical protein